VRLNNQGGIPDVIFSAKNHSCSIFSGGSCEFSHEHADPDGQSREKSQS
jgi:hypothetical protein